MDELQNCKRPQRLDASALLIESCSKWPRTYQISLRIRVAVRVTVINVSDRLITTPR